MLKEELERTIAEAGFNVLEKKDGLNLYIISIKKRKAVYVIYGFQNLKREIGELSVIKLKRYVSFKDTYYMYLLSDFTAKYKQILARKRKIVEVHNGVQLAELETILSQV